MTDASAEEEASYCTTCGFHADTRNDMIRHIRNFHKEHWAAVLEILKKQGYTDDHFKYLDDPGT